MSDLLDSLASLAASAHTNQIPTKHALARSQSSITSSSSRKRKSMMDVAPLLQAAGITSDETTEDDGIEEDGTTKKVPSVPVRTKRTPGVNTRVNKGLRHFSTKVCDKLRTIGETTHDHIANLLVIEGKPAGEESKYDEKNIRRRIYDALNVLMALQIIKKDPRNKKIRWQGMHVLPFENLIKEKDIVNKRLLQKKELLQEMTLQFIALKTLLDRNRFELVSGVQQTESKLSLPFLLVTSPPGQDILCEMSPARDAVLLQYEGSFSVRDENAFLRQIKFMEPESLQDLIPPELDAYLPLHNPRLHQKNNQNNQNSSSSSSSLYNINQNDNNNSNKVVKRYSTQTPKHFTVGQERPKNTNNTNETNRII